jgi:hypothetical protein
MLSAALRPMNALHQGDDDQATRTTPACDSSYQTLRRVNAPLITMHGLSSDPMRPARRPFATATSSSSWTRPPPQR